MSDAIINGIAKAIWNATYESPPCPWEDASALLRRGTLRQAKAAAEVFDAPMSAAAQIANALHPAAKLGAALDAEGDHVPDEGAECRVCAALGEMKREFLKIAAATIAMQAAREALEKEEIEHGHEEQPRQV